MLGFDFFRNIQRQKYDATYYAMGMRKYFYKYEIIVLLQDICQVGCLALESSEMGFPVFGAPRLVPPTSSPGFLIEILGKPIVILAKFRSNCHKA